MFLQSSIYIVFALLLIVSALLLLVVLMQRSKQEGLGAAFGAQMTDQAFGAQTTDVLKKGTVFFGTLFMLLCFVLAVLMNAQYKRSHPTDLTEGKASAAATQQPETTVPVQSVPQPDTPPATPTSESPEPAEAPAEAQ